MAGFSTRKRASARLNPTLDTLTTVNQTPLPTADEDVTAAEMQIKEALDKGEVQTLYGVHEGLSTYNRRKTIRRLLAESLNPVSAEELALIFGVSQQTIRNDYKLIREENTQFIRDIDTASVIAELRMAKNRTLRFLLQTLGKTPEGSTQRIQAAARAWQVELEYVDRLARHGLIHVEPERFVQEIRSFTLNVDIPLDRDERIAFIREQLHATQDLNTAQQNLQGQRVHALPSYAQQPLDEVDEL